MGSRIATAIPGRAWACLEDGNWRLSDSRVIAKLWKQLQGATLSKLTRRWRVWSYWHGAATRLQDPEKGMEQRRQYLEMDSGNEQWKHPISCARDDPRPPHWTAGRIPPKYVLDQGRLVNRKLRGRKARKVCQAGRPALQGQRTIPAYVCRFMHL